MLAVDQEPVAGLELPAEVNREPAEDIAQRVLQREAEHDAHDAGTCQQPGDLHLVDRVEQNQDRRHRHRHREKLAEKFRHLRIRGGAETLVAVVPDKPDDDERARDHHKGHEPLDLGDTKLDAGKPRRDKRRDRDAKEVVGPAEREPEASFQKPATEKQDHIDQNGRPEVEQRQIGILNAFLENVRLGGGLRDQ